LLLGQDEARAPLIRDAVAEEVADTWLVPIGVSSTEKVLDDGRRSEVLQPAGIIEERTAIQPGGGLKEHPSHLDAVRMRASPHPCQQALGNTPDIQTLPFDKCLLLVEFLAGNQFLKGLLELSEGAAPPPYAR
jgi:hypothetical protein